MGVPDVQTGIIYHVEITRSAGGEYSRHEYEKHEYYGDDYAEALRVVEHVPMLDHMRWTVTIKASGVDAARMVLLRMAEQERTDAV